jgi:hypothetical protein
MTGTRIAHAGLVALLLFLLAGAVWAGGSANYAVDWSILSGGGAPAESSSGAVTLNGSLGQTAIGPSAASHGSLGAGFWYGAGARGYTVYLPLVLRSY